MLVVAPHFDDEVIGCGGALLLHRAAGSAVGIVFATNCEGGMAQAVAKQVSALRRREAEQVAVAMGFDMVEYYPFADAINHEALVAKRLAATIESWAPTLIYAPFPADAHADHQSSTLALAQAVAKTQWQGSIHLYEIWSTMWPNAAVDVSDVLAEKERVVRMYASQIADRDYAAAITGLARYRGLPHRVAAAEAFHICTPKQLCELTRLLDQL